ncbi:MAG TPA: hypothetical protein VGI57_09425 [Usitatibacter sp.]
MNLRSIAFAAIAFALAATNAFADTKSKEDKIRRLATLGGITTRLDEEVAQVLARGRQTQDQMMTQVNANLEVPGTFRPKFDQANKKFIDALQPQWTTFEVIEIFVKAYSPLVSEEDVDAALAYLTSGAGQRNAAAQAEAASQIAAMVAARSSNRAQQAMQTYVSELRALVQQCNCNRKAAPPAKK